VIATGRLAEFTLVSLALIAAPGPNVMFVVSRSLQLGRAAGFCSALGGQAGAYAQVTAVAFGIGALVEQSVAVFTAIKLAGAAYLVYLGVQAIRHRRSLTEALQTAAARKAPLRLLSDGFLVGVTNPKGIILFGAVLPQFVDRGMGHVPLQMLLLGTIPVGIAVISDNLWGLAAGTARSWLSRSPRRLELIAGAGGLAMIGLGASLAVTGRRD
jgi:threonine/homoserine/homoserine lactone efflux protein